MHRPGVLNCSSLHKSMQSSRGKSINTHTATVRSNQGFILTLKTKPVKFARQSNFKSFKLTVMKI